MGSTEAPSSNRTTTRVAAAITAEMTRQKTSQVELSETTAIPRATLQRRLTGLSAFTVDELDRIATALQVDLTALLGDVA